MFADTGGSFTGAPEINKTYYMKGTAPAAQQWENGNVTATLSGTKLTVAKTNGAENGNMGTDWTAVGSAPAWTEKRATITELEIQDSVTSIGIDAFRNCEDLESVTIPGSVTSIGTAAFYACSELTRVTILSGVKSIGNAAFNSCSKLTSVTIPGSVTSIGAGAFERCTSLTSVTVPSGVTSIGVGAFWGCYSLTSVTIPSSVTSIGNGAFYNCTSLATVTFEPVSETDAIAGKTLAIGTDAFYSTKSGATVAYGTGNTVLYDNDTPITTETLLTAIENKTLTWKAAHTHSFTYSLESGKKNVVKAVCLAEGCKLEGPITLTIGAPERTVYGGESSAKATLTDLDKFVAETQLDLSDDSVQYYEKGKKEPLNGVPLNAGTYKAAITVGSDNDTVTAATEYTVDKADPTLKELPVAAEITYGQTLSESTLEGGKFLGVAPGGSGIPEGGEGKEGEGKESNIKELGNLTLKDNGSDLEETNIAVAGTFAWKDSAIKPAVKDSETTEYEVVFKPADNEALDSRNYNEATVKVKIKVKKADPEYTKPTGLKASYGDTLEKVTLPKGWTWKEANTETGSVGDHTFIAAFTPEDTDNYNILEDIELTVTVEKAPQDKPVVSSVNETISGKKDGAINGVTTAMEYKLASETEYKAVTGTSVTDLAAGTYNVRYAETETLKPSEDTEVIIAAGEKLIITFDSDGGSAVEAQSLDYNEKAVKPGDPSKTGYSLKEWQLDGAAYDFDTPVTENATLKAVWEINQYTVTFDTNGGSKVNPLTVDYGADVKAPKNPTKTGYTFNGWNPKLPATMPAKDITVKAKWKVNTYTITFDTADGSYIAPISAEYGSAVSLPDAPTRPGYTFVGWDKTFPSTMPAEDMTLTAIWKQEQYILMFDMGGSTAKYTLDFGETLAPYIPTGLEQTGYTFVGWDKEIPDTMPAENLTITAVWKAEIYTIFFDTDGGTDIAPIKQAYGTKVTPPADPTRTGYTFKGWDQEIPSAMPAKNIMITALWEENETAKRADPGTITPVTPVSTPVPTPVARTITGVQDDNDASALSWDAVPNANSYSLYIKKDGKYVYVQELGASTDADIIESTDGKYYVSAGGAYTIYEYDEKAGKFVKKGTLSADKAGTIKKANDVTNDFMVKYTDTSGKLSADNNSYTVSVKVYYKPAVKAAAGKGSVTLKWKKVEGATKYGVYKVVDGKLKLITETKKLSVKINGTKAGKTYTYAVKAFVDGKWTKVLKTDLVGVKAR